MALVLLNHNGGSPYGAFDGYDGLASTVLGGEVAHFVAYNITGSDLAAKDVADGYVGVTNKFRPIVSTTFATGQAADRPLFLTDDGQASEAATGQSFGYGTLFGRVVGGTAGQLISGGTSLGPGTATGSGKITLWQSNGMYGVTLDAVDTAADGLVPTNTSLTVGTALTFGANGKLTPVGSTLAAAFPGATNTVVAARLVEFSAGDTLVTTPRSLTRTGVAGSTLQFKFAVINFNPPA